MTAKHVFPKTPLHHPVPETISWIYFLLVDDKSKQMTLIIEENKVLQPLSLYLPNKNEEVYQGYSILFMSL